MYTEIESRVVMEKIWYIDIQGKREGPFSVFDLRRDERITPDTLVWKEGFTNWKPIRQVPELKDLFEDAKPLDEMDPHNFDRNGAKTSPIEGEIALDIRKGPPYFFWLFFFLVVLAYFLSQLLWMRS